VGEVLGLLRKFAIAPLGQDPAWPPDQEGKLTSNADVSTSEFSGHLVVALRGEFDLADGPHVAAHLHTAMAVHGPQVIVDLAGLEFIDCSGLGVLVRLMKQARERGGDLTLAAPQKRVRRLLTITGLTGIFSVYPSVQQAVRAAEEAPGTSLPHVQAGNRPADDHALDLREPRIS
jgi:anti-sigma B factor antagonist